MKIITKMMVGISFIASHSVLAQTPSSSSAVPAVDSGNQLEDIVVTAQRREESMQRVPVAITAIGQADLETRRVTNVQNLSGLAPSLTVTAQGLGSTPQITVRGISSGSAVSSVDPKIGVYLDGVYIGRSVGAIFDLADIQRVEVLRGPQGTLFGRNATGGAISITTPPPSGEFNVNASLAYGNYDAIRGKVSVDLPAFGPLSLKLSYLHDQIDGDVRNLIAGRTIDISARAPEIGVRRYAKRLGEKRTDGAQLAAQLDTGNLVANYRFDYTNDRTTGRASTNFGVLPNGAGPLVAPIVALQGMFGGITNLSDRPLKEVAAATSVGKVVTQGHSLTLAVEASDTLTVKSISAYRKMNMHPYVYDFSSTGGIRFTAAQLNALLAGNPAGIFDPANLPGPNDSLFSLLTARTTRQRQFSQEVQFLITQDKYEITSGVFYFWERSPDIQVTGIVQPVPDGVVTVNPVLDSIFGSGTTRTLSINNSMAGYVQGTYHLTDKLDITVGGRYTIDDRRVSVYSLAASVASGQLPLGTHKAQFEKFTYNGVLTYRPADDVTAYAKISTGYNAGGVFNGVPYQPETLKSYEVGVKSQLFDNRVRLNLSAYYSDYRDLQTTNFTNGVQTFSNAGKAKILGFEAETDLIIADGLKLSGSLGYANLDYKQFILGGVDVADEASTPYVSKWTGRAAAEYTSPELSVGGNIAARVEGRWRSRYSISAVPVRNGAGVIDAALDPHRFVKAYWLVDGRLGLANLDLGGSTVSISAFGQNIFNKRYNPFGAAAISLITMFDRGRTYGVEMGVRF